MGKAPPLCAARGFAHLVSSCWDTSRRSGAFQPARPFGRTGRRAVVQAQAMAQAWHRSGQKYRTGRSLILMECAHEATPCPGQAKEWLREQPFTPVTTDVGQAALGGRSMRAGMCPVKEESDNCWTPLTASSTALTATTGGGAHAPMQQAGHVPQPVRSWLLSQPSSKALASCVVSASCSCDSSCVAPTIIPGIGISSTWTLLSSGGWWLMPHSTPATPAKLCTGSDTMSKHKKNERSRLRMLPM